MSKTIQVVDTVKIKIHIQLRIKTTLKFTVPINSIFVNRTISKRQNHFTEEIQWSTNM